MVGESGATSRPALRHVMGLKHVNVSVTAPFRLMVDNLVQGARKKHRIVIYVSPVSCVVIGGRLICICLIYLVFVNFYIKF